MPKEKFSFTLDGIKYSDISAYSYNRNDSTSLSVTVAGTAQMIRQYLKHKYPKLPFKDYVTINSESFAGGDAIRINFNNSPDSFFSKIKPELEAKFEQGNFDGMTDSYNYSKSSEKSEDGRTIDYGTKYLTIRNNFSYGSNSPSVDWSVISDSSPSKKQEPKSSSSNKSSYSMGEVLMDCSGWIISKKTLPDGRIVYNAKIKPDTPKNRGDWNEIKGEIYVETGFKWGRFGAFEKWGTIASEAFVVKTLCDILGKYYITDYKPETTPERIPAPQSDDKKIIGLYVNGEFIQYVSSQAEGYAIMEKNYEVDKFKEMISNGQASYNMSTNSINVLSNSYVYGKNWGVPKRYGNELQFAFIDKGYMVYVSSKKNFLIVYKTSMVNDGVIINDNGGEFNLDRYGYNENIGSINYEIDGNPVSTVTLAYSIDDIVSEFFKNQKEEDAPKSATKSKEDIEKAIKGLQYLADKGNEKAMKAIKGLKYLINK
jgi:hypothetical protein